MPPDDPTRLEIVVEQADPAGFDGERLLRAHTLDMAARYGGDGTWEGTKGRKDAFWMAYDLSNHAAVGCVALRLLGNGDGDGEVKHLYVEPNARRHGVAAALMDRFEADAWERGVARIVLETGIGQPEALAFYADRGYRVRGPYPECEFRSEGSRYVERTLP